MRAATRCLSAGGSHEPPADSRSLIDYCRASGDIPGCRTLWCAGGRLRSSRRRRPHFQSRRCGFTLIELLVTIAVISVLAALLIPAVQAAREAARATSCRNNIRQTGIALHNFHDVYQVFPASGSTQPGPGNPSGAWIGWRALILPYLEQSALFNNYDFDADWWTPQNVSLGGVNGVRIWQCPSTPTQPRIAAAVAKPPRPAMTFAPPLTGSDYEAIMGIRPVIDPARYPNADRTRAVMYRNSTVRFADITDGTSNSIVVTECAARPAVYRNRVRRPDLFNDQGNGWIDSESGFSLDGASPDGSVQSAGPQLTPRGINATNENEPYSFHTGGAFFLFADGHVTFLSENMDLRLLAAFVTRAGGEVAVAQ